MHEHTQLGTAHQQPPKQAENDGTDEAQPNACARTKGRAWAVKERAVGPHQWFDTTQSRAPWAMASARTTSISLGVSEVI
jgi:hypothetical protein